MPEGGLEPTGASERVAELDVLRGIALFGVLLVNMVGFNASQIISTEQQLLSLSTAALDHTLDQLIQVFFNDKANTLFACLFGLGFYLQMQRAAARAAPFEQLYVRRLAVLLGIGVLHAFLIWHWDILHLYALMGFVLLALRRVSARTLLIGGLLLTLLDYHIPEWLFEQVGITPWLGMDEAYSEASVLARQALSQSGDYLGLVRVLGELTVFDYVSGGLLGWMLYALGRFMLGAWVGRQGWLQRAGDYLPGFRRAMRIGVPAGLMLEGLGRLVGLYADSGRLPEWDHWFLVERVLHQLALPLLAGGYLCAIVVGLHTVRVRPWLAPFAYVGRLALTNYIAQSLFLGLVLFGVGPGLALAGRIGTTALLGIIIAIFALQVIASRWWLAHFRFGPCEWLWRGLTYRTWPALRLPAAEPATGSAP